MNRKSKKWKTLGFNWRKTFLQKKNELFSIQPTLPKYAKLEIINKVIKTLFQSKNKYFLNSGEKVSYFFENSALDDQGDLLVPQEIALNKVGHYLHVLHPTFRKIVYSEKIREVCFRLGMEDPRILQSMYIYKNPGIGSEGKIWLLSLKKNTNLFSQ